MFAPISGFILVSRISFTIISQGCRTQPEISLKGTFIAAPDTHAHTQEPGKSFAGTILLEWCCHVLLSGKCLWRDANFWEADHHFEMTLRKISGCSFHSGGDSAPWGLYLLVLTPTSLLLETETSWQKQESHGTWQRKTCGSHMTNSIGHTVPAWNIFSLKLVKIWSDKVTQRLRSWEQHSLAIWELRQS